jgi:hypothetical protein
MGPNPLVSSAPLLEVAHGHLTTPPRLQLVGAEFASGELPLTTNTPGAPSAAGAGESSETVGAAVVGCGCVGGGLSGGVRVPLTTMAVVVDLPSCCPCCWCCCKVGVEAGVGDGGGVAEPGEFGSLVE